MPPHPTAPRPLPGDGHRSPPYPEPRPDPRAGGLPVPRPAPRPDGPPNGYHPGGPFPPARPPVPGYPNGTGNGHAPGHGDGATVRVETTTERPKSDLSPTKVIAGAGAAVTSAVLGSFFGADGTVVGAAFGSVASTVAATFYQRSLDRTRDTLVARVRVRRNPADPTDRSDSEMTVRLPPVDADGSVQPVLDEPAPRGRRWLLWAGATALVFALAMAVITGIELAKGSTITGGAEGTSVGRVVERAPAPPAEEEEPASTGTDSDTTATPEPTADPESSTTATPDPDAPGGAEGGSETQEDQERAPEDDPGGSVDVRPTERDAPDAEDPTVPDSDTGTGSGTGGASTGLSNRFGSGFGDRFADDAEATTVAPPTTRP